MAQPPNLQNGDGTASIGINHTYKVLNESDIEQLKQLLNVFGDAFNDTAAYQRAVPTDAYLHSFLSKTQNIVVVALDGSEVIGGLVAYVLEKFEQDRREIYIYDLAVAEPHRRKGIATHLINDLKTVAKEKDAYVIYVQADLGDDAAIKLYESLGKREDVLHFDIPVS